MPSRDMEYDGERERLARERDADEWRRLHASIHSAAPLLSKDEVYTVAQSILAAGFAARSATLDRLASKFDQLAAEFDFADFAGPDFGDESSGRRAAEYRLIADALRKEQRDTDASKAPPPAVSDDPWGISPR